MGSRGQATDTAEGDRADPEITMYMILENVKCKKTVTKGHVLDDSKYIIHLEEANPHRQKVK